MSENEESVEENPEAQAETTAEEQHELNESAIDQEVIQALSLIHI